MQWNRCHPCHHDIELAIVESFTAFLHGLLDSLGCHGTEPLFAHLCLQLRSSTASWCRAYFVSQRADALHWIVRWSWYWAWSCALLRFFSISIATMFAHLCLQLRSPSGAALCERLCVKVCVEKRLCVKVSECKSVCVKAPVCKSVCV